MDVQRWDRVQALFESAKDLDAEARERLLARSCEGDESLRAEVAELLAAADDADGFFAGLAGRVGALFVDDPDSAADSTHDPESVGAYRICRRIARGGMGTVYLAERADGEFEQRVAVKLLRRGLDTDDLLRRFRAERQILASLNHPHIAHLLDGGSTEAGLPYLVMEYVEGEPITNYCERRQLSIADRLQLFLAVAAAVQHAHDKGVVHRDLKPSNMLVTPGGVPKLLDFGIAKLLDASLDDVHTQTGVRLMTPGYASPEQVRGEAITPATDVYALGALLYELLAGRPPFRTEGRSRAEIERMVCTEDPALPSAAAEHDATGGQPELRKRSRRLRGDLDNIVLMALRKEPERRYASVAAMAEDIERYQEERPVRARPNRLHYRMRKFAQRRPGVMATVVAVLLMIGGYAVTGSAPEEPLVAERIVVLPFENHTGDASLDPVGRLAADWITQGISRSALGQVMPLTDLLQSLAPDQDAAALSVAEAARATGAGKVVVGSYYRIGDQLQFQARVLDAGRNALIDAVEPISADPSDPRDGIARLGQRVTGILAVSFDPRHLFSGSTIDVTRRPPTVEAYEAYADGLDRFLRRDWNGAIPLLLRATELDPTFHEPAVMAVSAYANAMEYEMADSLTAVLLEVRSELTTLDLLYLESLLASRLNDRELAMERLDRLAALFPAAAHVVDAGWQGVIYNRPGRSIRYLAAMDPTRGPMSRWAHYWHHYASAYHLLADYQSELEIARRSLREFGGSRQQVVPLEIPPRAARGHFAELRDAIHRVTLSGGATPGRARTFAAAELRAHGYADSASVFVAEAVRWYESRSPAEQQRLREEMALAYYKAGRYGESRLLYEMMLSEAAEPEDTPARRSLIALRGRLGTIAARQGNVMEAEQIDTWLASIDWPYMRGHPSVWRARIAATLGAHHRAVSLLNHALYVEDAYFGPWVHRDPDFVDMQHLPSFQEVLRSREG
jgi:serine/threonine protein kinase/tetratricopeptide (TPR) repeat protein